MVKTGKTPVLEGIEWRKLLASILLTTLRDLALIATLTYSFARDCPTAPKTSFCCCCIYLSLLYIQVATSCGRIAAGTRPRSSHQPKNRGQAWA
jgi:hypothetical protein